MINNPHIKILILNYNGENIIHQCLESALNLDYDNYSVDVIDNGSSDESVKIIREEFDSVSIHSIDKNLGYAKGYNYGFDKLKNQDFDYYLILNNDTVVVKNLLKNLLININKYGDSNIYGPKICYSNTKKIWFAGGLYNKFLGIAKHVGINEIEDNITYKTNITDYITGCCMLIKKDTIDKLNGFDDSYTMYYEDLDLCHRAYEYDTKCYIIEGDPIYHEVSYTIGAKSFHKKYHMLCSQLKFIYKINNPLFFIISIMINIILMPLFFIKKIVRI